MIIGVNYHPKTIKPKNSRHNIYGITILSD